MSEVFPEYNPNQMMWTNPKELQAELDEVNKSILQIKQEMKGLHEYNLFIRASLESISLRVGLGPSKDPLLYQGVVNHEES